MKKKVISSLLFIALVLTILIPNVITPVATAATCNHLATNGMPLWSGWKISRFQHTRTCGNCNAAQSFWHSQIYVFYANGQPAMWLNVACNSCKYKIP